MGAILNTYFNMLLKSLGNTMLLTLLSLVFALVIGLIFALMNVGKNRFFNLLGTIYVDAVRGVPLLVLAFFIYLFRLRDTTGMWTSCLRQRTVWWHFRHGTVRI